MKATSIKSGITQSSKYSLSDPRILVGEDRTKFVTTVLNSTFHPESTDAETEKLSKKISSKVSKLMELQQDEKHLEAQCLPKIPTSWTGPKIVNSKENSKNIMIVCTNESHTKATNPGYSRRTGDGGFFNH